MLELSNIILGQQFRYLVKNKMFSPNKFWIKNCWSKRNFVKENLESKKIIAPKDIWVKRSLVQKKCWPTKVKAPKKLGPKSLVKIEHYLTTCNVALNVMEKTKK